MRYKKQKSYTKRIKTSQKQYEESSKYIYYDCQKKITKHQIDQLVFEIIHHRIVPVGRSRRWYKHPFGQKVQLTIFESKTLRELMSWCS